MYNFTDGSFCGTSPEHGVRVPQEVGTHGRGGGGGRAALATAGGKTSSWAQLTCSPARCHSSRLGLGTAARAEKPVYLCSYNTLFMSPPALRCAVAHEFMICSYLACSNKILSRYLTNCIINRQKIFACIRLPVAGSRVGSRWRVRLVRCLLGWGGVTLSLKVHRHTKLVLTPSPNCASWHCTK